MMLEAEPIRISWFRSSLPQPPGTVYGQQGEARVDEGQGLMDDVDGCRLLQLLT